MPYMVTFTTNIPQMLALIYHTWILWETTIGRNRDNFLTSNWAEETSDAWQDDSSLWEASWVHMAEPGSGTVPKLRHNLIIYCISWYYFSNIVSKKSIFKSVSCVIVNP